MMLIPFAGGGAARYGQDEVAEPRVALKSFAGSGDTTADLQLALPPGLEDLGASARDDAGDRLQDIRQWSTTSAPADVPRVPRSVASRLDAYDERALSLTPPAPW